MYTTDQPFNLILLFRYEKMISGMYLGELVRLILVKAIENNLAFSGKGSEKMSTTWAFETRFISEVEA